MEAPESQEKQDEAGCIDVITQYPGKMQAQISEGFTELISITG
jgi:hypothetical protein